MTEIDLEGVHGNSQRIYTKFCMYVHVCLVVFMYNSLHRNHTVGSILMYNVVSQRTFVTHLFRKDIIRSSEDI